MSASGGTETHGAGPCEARAVQPASIERLKLNRFRSVTSGRCLSQSSFKVLARSKSPFNDSSKFPALV